MDQLAAFSNLPVEIRLKIWLESVLDDEAEVCLPWPSNVRTSLPGTREPLYVLPCQPLTVDVAFPVAMHVRRESRRAVQDSRRSGVLFRASQAAGCPTPFRRFRPDLDILYLNDHGIWFMHMFLRPELSPFDSVPYESEERLQSYKFFETLSQTRQLAVPTSVIPRSGRMIEEFLSDLLTYSHVPRQLTFGLCFVVATTRNITEMDAKDVHAVFMPPRRRCRLAAIEASDWDSILVATDDMRSNPPQSLGKVVAETVQEMRGFGKLVNGAPEFIDAVTVTAGTFVEYQRDGTWSEVCAGRMYSQKKLSFITEIAPDERPDPEIQRVHDTDCVFRERLDDSDSDY